MNRITSTFLTSLQTLNRNNVTRCDSVRCLLYASRDSSFIPTSCIHSSKQLLRKSKKELSSEPTRFTSSPANVRSMPTIPERNEYQPFIVSISLLVFVIYFLLLRQENDIDEDLNLGLFERVPKLEEPHLTQAIPRMRDAGIDTMEAEQRLQELTGRRLAKEAAAKEARER